MAAVESVAFANISATTAPFTFRGGIYVLEALATFGGGSVALQALGPDGVTYLPVNNLFGTVASLAAAGIIGGIALPAGQYRITIATATAVFVSVVSVPND